MPEVAAVPNGCALLPQAASQRHVAATHLQHRGDRPPAGADWPPALSSLPAQANVPSKW